MKTRLPILTLAVAIYCLGQNTALFPSATATYQNLAVAKDSPNRSVLVSGITSSALTAVVADGTQFGQYNIVTFADNAEQAMICSIASNTLTLCARGFGGTAAAAHSSGIGVIGMYTAWHHNQLAAEVYGIEQALGANFTNLGWLKSGSIVSYTGGNVGIGTSGPAAPLHVAGGNAPESGTSTPNGTVAFQGGGGSGFGITMGTDSSGVRGWIQSRSMAAATWYPLLLQPSGSNVLIGPSANTAKLTVTDPSANLFSLNGAGGEVFRVLNSGAVGVGTGAPTAQLTAVFPFTSNAYATVASFQAQASGSPVASVYLLMKSPTVQIVGGTDAGSNSPALLALVHPNASLTGSGMIQFASSNSTTSQLNAGTFTALTSGQVMGQILFGGDSGVNIRYAGARVWATTTSNWSGTNMSSELNFDTTPVGSANYVNRMKLTDSGTLRMFGPVLSQISAGDYTGAALTNLGSGLPALKFAVSDGTSRGQISTTADTVVSGAASVMDFYTSVYAGTSTFRMRLDGSGNLGIGTTAPATKLHVLDTTPTTGSTTVTIQAGAGQGANGLEYWKTNAGSTLAYIGPDGSVVSNSATSQFGPATNYLALGTLGSAYNNYISAYGSSANININLVPKGSGNLVISNGNVLVGSGTDTTAGAKLQLAGNIQLSAGTTTAQPTCDATHAGILNYSGHTASVKDTAAICAADASNAWAWRTIY